jgi:hypothetical protein
MGSGGIAAHSLNLSTRWRLVVSFMPWHFHLQGERVPGTHWIGGWVDPGVGVDMVVKRKIPCLCQELNLSLSACSLVTVLTVLPWLLLEISNTLFSLIDLQEGTPVYCSHNASRVSFVSTCLVSASFTSNGSGFMPLFPVCIIFPSCMTTHTSPNIYQATSPIRHL